MMNGCGSKQIGKTGPAGIGRRRRILIVDGNVQTCRQLADYLAGLGYECFCEDGISRRRLRRFSEMDVAIVDLALSGWNGIDLVGDIYAGSYPRPGLIFVSGLGSSTMDAARNYAEVIGLEVLGCFGKPAEASVIAACIAASVPAIGRKLALPGVDGRWGQERFAAGLEGYVRHSIDTGHVSAWYMPRISAEDCSYSGCDVELGDLMSEFGAITGEVQWRIARETGRFEQLLTEVTRQALFSAAEWSSIRRNMPSPPARAVSLRWSRDLLMAPHGSDRLSELVKEAGLAAQQVTVLLRRTAEDPLDRDMLKNLIRLREQGFGLGLDRIGCKGALMALTALPLTEVRLDPFFVASLAGPGRRAATVTRRVISMCRKIGLRVVASGVETGMQLSMLREAGCSEIRGPFIANRIPAARMVAWVDMWQSALRRCQANASGTIGHQERSRT